MIEFDSEAMSQPGLSADNVSANSEPRAAGLREALVAKLLLLVLFGIAVGVAFRTESTYDIGDSIYHYLFARYVPQHPENLLNSWAKPLFTLMATLPAQGGFLGMKLFQCTVVAASAWLAYVIARALRLPWPMLAILFCYAAPDYFRIQYSGLTEPLFGLILVGAVALAMTDRPVWSAALIAWLPFVRSEGALLLGLWLVYLAWNRHWRAIPLLLTGFIVYSVVGGVVNGDFGWLVTQNPYGFHSQYGSGRWLHFLEHLPTLLGWALLAWVLVGILRMFFRLWHRAEWSRRLFRAELLLIYGVIVAFIGAHTAFWALGLFGSFGMTRVLTVLTPLCAVVALSGLVWVSRLAPREWGRQAIATAGVLAVVIMLFSRDHGYNNENYALVGWHSNLHWSRDFKEKTIELRMADQATNWLKQHDANWRQHPFAFESTYYSIALNVDLFDPFLRVPLAKDWAPCLDGVPVGTYVFWDHWFCPTEAHLPLALLQSDGRFVKLWEKSEPFFPTWPEGGSCQVVLFQKVR